MRSLNKVQLVGAMGKDPEIRQTAQGLKVANFSLATSKKNKNEEEITSWHRCTAFGKEADAIDLHTKKGTRLFIDGEIRYEEYEKEGVKMSITKIIVQGFAIIPKVDKFEKPEEPQGLGSAYKAPSKPEYMDELPF